MPLAYLASNAKIKMIIAVAGAIPPLVELLTPRKSFGAALALVNLAASNAGDEIAIAKVGAIPLVVEVLTKGTTSDDAKVEVAKALAVLAFNAENKMAIAEAGAIPLLAELVTSGTSAAKMEASEALRRLEAPGF